MVEAMRDYEAPQMEEWRRLRFIGAKLRGLSHLIEMKGPEEAEPLDQPDIQWGLAMLMQDLSKEILKISETLEKVGIQRLELPTKKNRLKKKHRAKSV
jgi:hypothetical protein